MPYVDTNHVTSPHLDPASPRRDSVPSQGGTGFTLRQSAARRQVDDVPVGSAGRRRAPNRVEHIRRHGAIAGYVKHCRDQPRRRSDRAHHWCTGQGHFGDTLLRRRSRLAGSRLRCPLGLCRRQGRRIGTVKGSGWHFVVVGVGERARLSVNDVDRAFLSRADATAVVKSGAMHPGLPGPSAAKSRQTRRAP
jgi:hypothetical protein